MRLSMRRQAALRVLIPMRLTLLYLRIEKKFSANALSQELLCIPLRSGQICSLWYPYTKTPPNVVLLSYIRGCFCILFVFNGPVHLRHAVLLSRQSELRDFRSHRTVTRDLPPTVHVNSVRSYSLSIIRSVS